MPTATDKDVKHTAHPHGIPEIVEREEKEEARVRKKLAAFAEERVETQRKAEEDRKKAEAEARSAAKQELEEYKKQELTKILEKGEESRETHLKAIDAGFKKRASAAADRLVARLASGELLS